MAYHRLGLSIKGALLASLLCLLLLSGYSQNAPRTEKAELIHVEPEVERHLELVRSIPLETHQSANRYFKPQATRRLLDYDDAEPIRIHVEYQLDNLPYEKAQFMKEKLIPVMQGVFKRSLKVKKPVKGTFYLPYECVSFFPGYPGYCHKVGNKCLTARHNKDLFGEGRTCIQPFDDQCVRIPKGRGVDADFVLYVTATAHAGCLSGSETVATAGFCIHDYDNWYGLPGRPLAGAANFCPSNIYTEDKMFSFMLDTAVHEVIHALIMSKSLFGMYLTAEGESRANAVVDRGGYLTVTTPSVVKAAQEILGCSSMSGAKLENEGGYGTADSHWERRLFMGELMIGTASATSRVILSNLTLALAEDSGWYLPNYANSGVLSSIEHRGCGFVNRDCHRYNKELEETFCWDGRPVNQQPAICSADHMAVGYCNNGISLIGGCYVKQPFSNLHCTNPDHQTETGSSVDMGLRHQPGARCFKVESSKIQRTQNWVSAYRTNPGAVCFDAYCEGNKLYIHIPATDEFGDAKIRCPTGGYVDLADYNIGYDEGTIGPCPNNKLVCESWGCPNDCNSHGRCMQGKCYCDLGYVGHDCKNRPCPEQQCDADQECDVSTGLCYQGGLSSRPGSQEYGESTETVAELPSWASRPSKHKSKPTTTGSSRPKKPSSKESRPEPIDEPTVPYTQPHEEPKPSTPYRPPMVPEQPKGPSEETIGVPVHGDEGTSGKALGVGYLDDCLLFEDSYGDQKVRQDSVRLYTGAYGKWSLEYYPREDDMIIDPDYGDCYDMFTNLRPMWRLRGFKTVRMLSAISTLAALAPTADAFDGEGESSARKRENSVENRSSKERRILAKLGLNDRYILQRDFILQSYMSNDRDAKRAVIYNAMLVNTVVQISCYADTSTMPSFRTSDLLFRIVASYMERGVPLKKLVHTGTVYLIVDRISDTTNGRTAWILSETVANINQILYSRMSGYSGVELLEMTARFTNLVQTKLCLMAAELGAGAMEWTDYQDETSKRNLRRMADQTNIPDIVSIMSQEPDNQEKENDTKMNIPFLDSHMKEVAFVGGLMGILVISACVFFCYRSRRSQ